VSDDKTCVNPVLHADAAVIVGLLAVLEGAIWGAELDLRLLTKTKERFIREGLLPVEAQDDELRQAVSDMSHRLRYALGSTENPPARHRYRADRPPGGVLIRRDERAHADGRADARPCREPRVRATNAELSTFSLATT